ncbi:hypothetical protein [Mycobacterium sp. DL440]|uniref:hypothetical protein n=1 Tax=Mycobacterium sp. DL440 TaxID=2675523 RepID=UPI001FB8D007|nr:hypothetical protein [Mycobacterium sp. DL440]
MAVRPLVTTGAALLSAGAIVAATPALFVPRDEITVAATTVVPAPTRLTQEQINLLALSLQGAWQSFTQGYGGLWFPGQSPKPAEGILVTTGPDTGNLVDAHGTPLYNADGTRATGPVVPGAQYYNNTGAPVYEIGEDGEIVTQDDPGNCTAEGAVCQKGFTGLAYYLSDNILPLGDIDNIFFEGGFTELAHQAIRTVAVAIDAVDPTGRLDLTNRVDDFFEGGATQLVGNLLLDNLPQDGYAYGLTNSFFFGYGANTGIYAAFTYVVDAIAQGTPTPNPNLINPLDSGPGVQTLDESGPESTTLLAKKETGPALTSLPGPASLLNLSTKFDSPFKGLVKLPFKAPAADETKLVEDLDATEGLVTDGTENSVEGGTETTPLGVELPTPEAPKFEAPKLPEFKLPQFKAPAVKLPEVKAPEVELPEVKAPEVTVPELKAPELKPALTPKSTIRDKEITADDDAKAGTDTKTGNKFTPPILFGDGKPKGESNGSKFLKKLGEAVQNATGGGKDKGTDGGSGDK